MTARRTIAGFSLKAFAQAPNFHLRWHEHEHPSICFVVSGFYAERARGREQECAARSMVCKPAGEPHSDIFGRTGARCLLIEMLPARAAHVEQFSRVTSTPCLVRSARLAMLGHRLHDEFFATDLAAPLALEGGILEVLAEVSRSVLSDSSRTEPPWLRRVRELLHDQVGDSFTLSQVANDVGVNASHIARTFRKRYGCTVGDYVRRLRIERASNELATSKDSIAAIGARAGFFDQSHFARVFRRQMGMTPVEYRRHMAATSA